MPVSYTHLEQRFQLVVGHRDGALYFPLADGPEARVGNFLHRVLVRRVVELSLIHILENT